MKNIDDILAQFDLVPEPAVSAETLGAYIEGNLSPEESLEVEAVLDDSPELSYLMDAATDPEPEIFDDLSLDDLPDLPEVPGMSDADDIEVEILDEPVVVEDVEVIDTDHEPLPVDEATSDHEPMDIEAFDHDADFDTDFTPDDFGDFGDFA